MINSEKTFVLDSVYKYTAILEFSEYLLNVNHPKYHFSIDFKNEDCNNSCYLVAEHKRSGRVFETIYFPLNQYSIASSKTERAFFCFYPPNEVSKNDRVQFFLWNPGVNKVFIKRLRVELYK